MKVAAVGDRDVIVVERVCSLATMIDMAARVRLSVARRWTPWTTFPFAKPRPPD
jgi:hypothetical protein